MAITMTVNLRKQLVGMHTTMRRRRTPTILKAFIARHQKVDADSIRIDAGLNDYLSINVTRSNKPMTITIEKEKNGTVTAKMPGSGKKIAEPAKKEAAKSATKPVTAPPKETKPQQPAPQKPKPPVQAEAKDHTTHPHDTEKPKPQNEKK